ncbi:MAG: YhgE/Pip family protein [Bifidobacteriaceae bacterium]|nr:YhgE/Pip family protein [Bifidobacteriaceae bacterium]
MTVVFKGLRKALSSTFMKIAVTALILIPSLYTGFYLWANYDPYTLMKNVPVALANEDIPINAGGKNFDLGQSVAKQLIDKGVFDIKTTPSQELKDGVYNGKYLFGIIIPHNFSQQISTLYSSIIKSNNKNVKPEQGQIILVTNDANNFIINTAATQLSDNLQKTISAQVMKEFSDNLLKGLTDVHNNLYQATEASKQISQGTNELKINSKKIKDALNQLSDASASLPDIMNKLARGSQQVAQGDAKLASVADNVEEVAQILDRDWNSKIKPNLINIINSLVLPQPIKDLLLSQVNQIDQIVAKVYNQVTIDVKLIDKLAAGAKQLSDGLATLSAKVPQLISAIQQLSQGYNQFDDSLNKLAAASDEFAKQLELGYEKIPSFDDKTRNQINNVIATPVSMLDQSQAKSANYGVGLAPFFISLSTWVGAYALFVLIKPFKQDELTFSKSNIRSGLGSYLIPALFGICQMICLYITVELILHLPIAHHLLLLLFMFLVSATFIAIMFCLVAVLDMAGLYIGLILLILQITSCGGTFPIQTTPVFFQFLHHILPMSYSVDAIRHIINSQNYDNIHQNMLIIGSYLVVFLALVVIIATIKRHKWKNLIPPILKTK